jgi:hypothetical protein
MCGPVCWQREQAAASDTAALARAHRFPIGALEHRVWLQHALGMRPKKQSEVAAFSALAASLAGDPSGPRIIVDVGAGRGHLVHALAAALNSPAVAVDADKCAGDAVRARSAQLRKRRCPCPPVIPLHHRVTLGDEAALWSSVEYALSSEYPHAPCKASRLLCGLHACGNVSSAILRCFVNSTCSVPGAHTLVLVPCCHNLISEPSVSTATHDGPGHSAPTRLDTLRPVGLRLEALCTSTSSSSSSSSLPGFPLSDGVRRLGITLGEQGRNWATRSAPSSLEDFWSDIVSVAQRAALERILCDTAQADSASEGGGECEFRVPRGTGSGRAYSFGEYVKQLVCSLGDADREKWSCRLLHPSQLTRGETLVHELLPSVAVLVAVGMCLGPVLETLIALDRLLYLSEHGNAAHVWMALLFDPDVSPRHIALVARQSLDHDTSSTDAPLR